MPTGDERNEEKDISPAHIEPLPFWKTKSLREMTRWEWEMLCDGCGKCCLHKIIDEKTGTVYYTNVTCRLLNTKTCRCTSYKTRGQHVPTCMILTPRRVEEFDWLPETCAYRLLSQGKDLPWWHRLVSGDPDLIHRLNLSVKGKTIPEEYIHPMEIRNHIVDWE